jgi:flavorubredoxin
LKVTWRSAPEISKGIYWVGVRDWNRKIFDALIPMPKGTTYNAYLVIGDNKAALIDTVNPGFETELEEKIRQIIDPEDIDYVVMNHAEPDHAGAIPHMLSINNKAEFVLTARGSKLAQRFYNVPENRLRIVHEGDRIDLGGKTLRFIDAPLLHWPETMFTYVPENKILFPCDFMGLHIADGLFDDEADELLIFAQRYFGEIIMPFRVAAKNALDKLKSLEIEMIAPSHGPIHRNTKRILDAYGRWASGETKQKVTVVYVTMWKSTEKMVKILVDTLQSEGIEVSVHDLLTVDVSDLARDLVDSRAIVLGAPTVLNTVHPLAANAVFLVKALHPPAKYAAVLSSYGWGAGAVKAIQEMLGPSKMEVVGAIDTNGPPHAEDIERIVALGKQLAAKIRQG